MCYKMLINIHYTLDLTLYSRCYKSVPKNDLRINMYNKYSIRENYKNTDTHTH